MAEISLPPGFQLRPASLDDLDAVAELTRLFCTDEGDSFMAESAEDLRNDWSAPGRDITRDAWVVIAPGGQLVGYEEGLDRHAHAVLFGGGYVHPDYQGMGIGTALVRRLEVWAQHTASVHAPDLQVIMDMGGINGDHKESHALLEAEGYQPARYFWRMQITLDAAPAAPAWPDGIRTRPFEPEYQARAVYEADEEAFQDHWGHLPTPFERWKHRRMLEHPLDPALWHIAWDGEEVAGYSLSHMRQDIGWVSNLGVRRPWRKCGLGLALLLQSFAAFYERGIRQVGLGVDADHPTGATRLYEKAGMEVVQSYITYRKFLRPGREISVQS